MLHPILCALLSAGLLLTTACTSKSAETAATPCAEIPAAYSVTSPEWARNASIYEVNIRQYTPEGTFRAFEQHLPRLQKMGVVILWLMPIQPIGEKNRKGSLGSAYSIRDYRAVNPDMGTMADVRHLVAEAHKLGMHVILDWVANHTSWDSKLATEHPEWFTKNARGQFRPPVADWQDVIDLDYRKPELQQYMRASMAFWVREADLDGFRCDVAGLVPTPFWEQTRAELEKIKPVFMLAEWDELFPPTFLKPGEFDPNTHLLEKAFDMTYGLRLHDVLDSVARRQRPAHDLNRYLARERRMYPPSVYLMNFTSSHDINSWDGSEYERLGPNVQATAVLAALLPGMPMVYSGQEAALKKRLKFFDKDPIEWGNYPLENFYTKLLTLKKQHPALLNGDACSQFRALPVSDSTSVFAFTRSKGAATVLVAVNVAAQPRKLRALTAPEGSYRELFSGQMLRLASDTELALAPHGYVVYERVKN
ncbi:alpha-glucosidase C-terminal domain-containing protein [Hymenobacter sp. BT635]|uniref:Alpha-glucosidase C-terminal domain-containing protein n=1 Tax=Hymenobacter nitidus TaxID=2880929 RepID=A0ABS8AD13_9BACT|nr:alpha-amylase family glycosyl hydrolase [Hymenobacter nitidus]MCB2378298.1 alpha-glucosidase C-terminal domain-containing protein [Hymenobacter nitidus]